VHLSFLRRFNLIHIALLGVALLFAPWLVAFSYDRQAWSPHGTRLGLWALYPYTIIYILANVFVFVVSWFPSSLQDTFHTKSPVVSSFVGPTVSVSFFAAGALYWLWDRKILKRLGYRLEVLAEHQEGVTVQMTFNVCQIFPLHSFRLCSNYRI
jgi:hypothetical protein